MPCTKKALEVIVAALSALTISANASMTGTVTDALNVRQAPGTESVAVGRLYPGDNVDIKDKIDNWYMIDYNGNESYVSADYVETSAKAISNIGRGVVTVDVLNIRQEPSATTEIIAKLAKGDVTNIVALNGEWYKIQFGDSFGYVFADYVVVEHGGAKISREASPRGRELSPLGQKAVEYAMKFKGVPYKSAGRSPKGFDCSGFTSYVYENFGIELPHSSDGQAGYGKKVSKDSLHPGDLVFFSYYGKSGIDHVGIYIGNNQFIHATKPGSTVQISSLDSDYYKSNYITARHIGE